MNGDILSKMNLRMLHLKERSKTLSKTIKNKRRLHPAWKQMNGRMLELKLWMKRLKS